MNTIKVAQYGTDLSSRTTGRSIRNQLLDLAADGSVVLDFNGVFSVSHSFADELLAVLVEDLGEKWFCEHIQVVNHSEPVRSAILDAIYYRLTASPEAA